VQRSVRKDYIYIYIERERERERERESDTFLARKEGCLFSPPKRLTGTSSKSTPFSWRHTNARVVFVDTGIP
jgi:hypothetical protein